MKNGLLVLVIVGSVLSCAGPKVSGLNSDNSGTNAQQAASDPPARTIPGTGYEWPMGVDPDDRVAEYQAKALEWEANRVRLWDALPNLNGDQAAFDRALAALGPHTTRSSDIENRHVPGQVDQRLTLEFAHAKANVYRANLDPTKYIAVDVVITGKIGVEPIDALFDLSPDDVAKVYGVTRVLEGQHSLGPVNGGRLTDLSCTFSGDRVESLIFSGTID